MSRESNRGHKTYQKPTKGRNDKEYVVTSPSPLLEYLLKTIKGQSRNNIKHLLSSKKVLVDGVSVSQFDYQLHAKQVIRISSVPIIQSKSLNKLKIIYEDEDFVAINKPAGLLSVATEKEDRETAYRLVSDYVRMKDKHNHVYVVHRLDKETSGVLMFTKSLKMKDLLQDDWNKNVTLREYYAIVMGELDKKEGIIKSYLMQNKAQLMYSSTNKKLGQEAITEYKVIKSNKQYSLLKVHLHTGRKNQIRVHFSEKGHPVIGDDKYGERVANPLHRLALHAKTLAFVHPITHKTITISAEMPKAFNRLF